MRIQLSIVICILCICIGCGKKEEEYGVEIRPEDFPEILVPPKDATEIRYSSPETGKIVEGTYSVSFWLNEEYPAENTIDQIQSHLQSQDCVRVKGSVLSDLTTLHVIEGEGFNKKVVDMSDKFRESLKQTERSTETQWRKPHGLADILHSIWSEEWITPDDDKVSVLLTYYFPDKGYGGYRIWVHLTAFTPSSWMYPHVQRYKENHPEQFKDFNETETKSPGD
jgi:hypothetical protein